MAEDQNVDFVLGVVRFLHFENECGTAKDVSSMILQNIKGFVLHVTHLFVVKATLSNLQKINQRIPAHVHV